MTRNNLDSNISWLLSNKPIPPVGVVQTASTNSGAATEQVYANLAGASRTDPVDSSYQESPIIASPPATSIAPEFIRPSLTSNLQDRGRSTRNPQNSSTNEAMARLQAAPKSTRPGLMVHNGNLQLVTPASSRTTSTLMSTYAASLQKEGL